MRGRSALALAMLLALTGCADADRSEKQSERRVAVHGSAVIRVAPDRVAVSLGVESRGPSVSSAFADNTARVASVLDALKRRGVEPSAIQTSRLDVGDVQDRDGKHLGYRVSNMVVVTSQNPSDIAGNLQAGVDAGANQIGNLHFFVAEPSTSLQEGLKLAFGNARSKAETLASLSGSTLGGVISISDDTSYVNTDTLNQIRSLGYVGSGAIEPGLEERTINVSVVFELK